MTPTFIISKNGYPFIAHCVRLLQQISHITPVIIDNGYSNPQFLDDIRSKYGVDVVTHSNSNGFYSWMEPLLESQSEKVFVLHDTTLVKKKEFFSKLEDLNTDIAAWTSFDPILGTDPLILASMRSLLSEDLWISPASTIGIGLYSLPTIRTILTDPTLRTYLGGNIYPEGYALERLLNSYLNIYYGLDFRELEDHHSIRKSNFKGIPVCETDYVTKYQASFIMGRDRTENLDLVLFPEDK